MAVQLRSSPNFLRAIAKGEGIAQKEINNILRAGAIQAGEWWIKTCLKRHFTNTAYPMYGYRKRSTRTTQKKMTRPEIFDPQSKRWVKNPFLGQQTLPLVYTGSLRGFVMSNLGSYQAKATAKFSGDEQRQLVNVRVPIRLNHPINPANAGELTRLADSEKNEMRRIISRYAKGRIKEAVKKAIPFAT